jgi:hypothetical protein
VVLVLPGPVGDRPLTGPAVQLPPAPVATTDPADLATTLPQLAERAAAQAMPADEPYDYLHIRRVAPTVVTYPDGHFEVEGDEEYDRERWTGDDGPGRAVDTVRGQESDWSHLPGPKRLDLPADPAALEDFLLSRPGNHLRKPSLYYAMEQVSSVQVIEPPVQAALLRLLASKPGVHVVGPTTDRLGRPGLAVAVTETGEVRGDPVKKRLSTIEHTLIFDRRTGALLAYEPVLLEGGENTGPRPLSLGQEMVLTATRVASTTERP